MKHFQIRGATAAEIADSVERGLQGGTVAPGQRLPPIRPLAAALRVSPVTVAAAYRQLRARGLVEASGRRGTRVRAAVPTWLPAAGPALIADGLRDLASGDPDPELLPPLEPALRALPAASRLYGGDEPVLPALAAFAADDFGADGIAATALAVTSGALDAIERLLREHLRPGDRVAVEDPCVPALLDLVNTSGYVVQPVALDGEGPQPPEVEEALARGARALVVTSRAQNPTGAALSPSRAEALARLLRPHEDVLLIENDPAGPVAGTRAAPIAGAPARWAVVRSVSKFLGPDLRLAVVTGDDLTIARMQGRHALGPRWVSHLLQQLALTLWSDPSNGRRLARATDIYAQRRGALVAALGARGITTAAPSGFNVWIPVRAETAVVQALAARGWAVAAGERFRLRSGPGIRITTSALDVDSARRLADDCAQALRPSAAGSA